ncbi:MAG: hypothetical protein WCI77_03315 [Candidatus Omnitrophota bacterium]
MTSIFYFIIIILIAYGLGKLLFNLFIRKPNSLLEDFTFSVGLGLALLGYVVYIIGSLGFLYQKYILTALMLCVLVAIYPAYRFIYGFRHYNISKTIKSLNIFEKFLIGIIIFVPVVCLFGALAPEIGNDTLSYHLYHPKIFIENHKIGYIPFTRESLWPYLAEMLFTMGLILKSVTVAKLFHYFFGILSAMAVFSFTRKFFSQKVALLATALFLSAPGIFMQMVYSYIDLAQCFYSFLAFYVLMLWMESKHIRLLMLSAVFVGLTISVKLLGGITLLVLCLIMLLEFIRIKTNYKNMLKYFFIFGFITFLVCCVWYIRSYFVLGNPVYPFLHNIFGTGWETNINVDVGTKKDFLGFLMLPWDVVMQLDSFGGQQIGVIFLAFLPFLFFVSLKNYPQHYLFIFLICHALLWFVVDPQLRFTFANFAVAFILISIGFYGALRKYNLSFIKILLLICILFNMVLCVYYNIDAIKLSFGLTSKENYILHKERTYPIATFVNKNFPSNSVVIAICEPRGFYFDRKIIFYDIWENVTKGNIYPYIAKLKKDKVPVYLLFRDDGDLGQFKTTIAAKIPIYKIAREVDEGRFASYYLFEL